MAPKSAADIDKQIAELRAKKKAVRQQERSEARRRTRHAQHKLGADMSEAVGATTETHVELLREILFEQDKVIYLRNQLGTGSAPRTDTEPDTGGGHYGGR